MLFPENVNLCTDPQDCRNGTQLLRYTQSLKTQLVETCETTIQGWILALEMHDGESREHAFRVSDLCLKLAHEMRLTASNFPHLRNGALLHDIGKLGVPGSILKKPGPLDETEWQIIKKHPDYAYDLLSPISFLQPALDIPRYHHEKWDGTGYPRGLKAEQIPLSARIFAIVDVWDALCSKRPYRSRAWNEDEILSLIREQSGRHFDPHVVNTFISLMGI
ncbi:MAG TPA: HD domain-containing phosphohydrolase [Anaerolineales bacterium]|nr:HD domain-containing phosphohydrolase [Anaerolineales bacterium]